MALLHRIACVAAAAALSACASQPGEDYGIDSKKLSTLQATLWTDPGGCDHWVIDDGAEGYLTARLGRDGRPVCKGPGGAPASVAKRPLEMTLWTDQRGCQHWVRDTFAEGYMSPRLDRQGRPVCPGAVQPAPSETVTLAADALFDTDKADLRPAAVSELTEFGQRLGQLGKNQVLVVGHTDSRASDAYNQSLSDRRAAAVAAFLRQRFGIVTQTEGRGEREPVASNATAAGRQANRRVEISILN
ncbi:MAG: OmpA family protein [Pseudomonadota bacterium]